MKGKADVLLGLQWGDEGKGKIVDVLTPHYDVIARFQGGPNAGHTLEFNGIKHVLHTIPSGIFRDDVINLVGNGVVIDPVVFARELDALAKLGVDVSKKLLVSKKAHLILPSHRLLDAASEASKGKEKIGSTLKGIGPTYMDKTGRNGIRVGDIFHPDFKKRYNSLVEKHKKLLEFYKFEYNLAEHEPAFFAGLDKLKALKVVDSEYFINDCLKSGKSVLCEGAQGSLLDVDFGTYPFVTSSTTTTAGACTGLGLSPRLIGRVIGIFKAYATRVGSGPFTTELDDEVGEMLRQKGNEFGSTTGRPRRCGWIDLPALKYAIMINGVTELTMMKADVLNDFDTIQVCTGYKVNGKVTDTLPYDLVDVEVEAIYKEMKGWKTEIKGDVQFHQLPEAFINYVDFLEAELGLPVNVISYGPDRSQTLIRKPILVE